MTQLSAVTFNEALFLIRSKNWDKNENLLFTAGRRAGKTTLAYYAILDWQRRKRYTDNTLYYVVPHVMMINQAEKGFKQFAYERGIEFNKRSWPNANTLELPKGAKVCFTCLGREHGSEWAVYDECTPQYQEAQTFIAFGTPVSRREYCDYEQTSKRKDTRSHRLLNHFKDELWRKRYIEEIPHHRDKEFYLREMYGLFTPLTEEEKRKIITERLESEIANHREMDIYEDN